MIAIIITCRDDGIWKVLCIFISLPLHDLIFNLLVNVRCNIKANKSRPIIIIEYSGEIWKCWT